MSSFFTNAGKQNKRKRGAVSDVPQKRVASSKPPTREKGKTTTSTKRRAEVDDDESISGSESDDIRSPGRESQSDSYSGAEDSDEEVQTAAERRLKLAEQYLQNIKEHVDVVGFDAAEIDRDLIAERLQEDVAETKGRVYRQLASELSFGTATQTLFRSNTNAVTAIAAQGSFFYTTSKNLHVQKWRLQDLPKHQWPKTTKKKPKKPDAPPKRRPELVAWLKGNTSRRKDRNYHRHTDHILAIAASPDGKYVVTGGQDKKIIVYEAETLKPIKMLMHHRDAVTGLVFRRGTNQLYSCSKDRTVKVWSLDEMAYVETLFGHQDQIAAIDALAQERCVSVGSRDRTARLWKVMEESQLVFRGGAVDKKARPNVDPRSMQNEGSMDHVALIDDELFVTGSDNGSISLWSVTKKKPLYVESIAHGVDTPLKPSQASAEVKPDPAVVPAPTPRWITALKTIPYSDVILSGSWDGCVRVWKLSEDKKKIEAVGVLASAETSPVFTNGTDAMDVDSREEDSSVDRQALRGVISGIGLVERGDRGKDGLCVIVAISKELRLGRWKTFKEARNGGVVFEVPRLVKPVTNGVDSMPEEEL